MTSPSGSLGYYTQTFSYDAVGNRVKAESVPSISLSNRIWIYNSFGEVVAKYADRPSNDIDASSNTVVSDAVGSARLGIVKVTQPSRNVYIRHEDFFPFGESILDLQGPAPRIGDADGGQARQSYCKPWDGPICFASHPLEDFLPGGAYDFAARSYRGAQGRFMSPDRPLLDQHFADPQSWNLYSYVRNNPLRFIDPTGRTLTASQGWSDMQGDLCGILGSPDCANRISRDQKTGAVSIDFDGIDLSKNEGAQLLSDLISSGNTYDLSYGSSVQTSGRMINVTFIENLDRNSDWRYGKGKTAEDQPRAGVDGQVAFNWSNITIKPNPLDPQSVPGSGSAPALRWTTVFHELAESYAKVDKGMQYMDRANPGVGAHWNAVDRERAMRNQRPYLRFFQFGSGGGTTWQPSTRIKR